MKNSKQLPLWLRKRRWSIYIKMHPIMRKHFGIRNFEEFCKMQLHSDIYQMTLKFLQYRPKLKTDKFEISFARNETKLRKLILSTKVKPLSKDEWKKARLNAYNTIK